MDQQQTAAQLAQAQQHIQAQEQQIQQLTQQVQALVVQVQNLAAQPQPQTKAQAQQREAAQNRGVISKAFTYGRRDAGPCRGAACSDKACE